MNLESEVSQEKREDITNTRMKSSLLYQEATVLEEAILDKRAKLLWEQQQMTTIYNKDNNNNEQKP